MAVAEVWSRVGCKWVGHLQFRWWGSYAKVDYIFCFWLKKNTGLQGSILSGHRMTTGFGNIELPTRGLLQKGREHSLPKFCFAELASPAFWLAQLLLWAFTVLKLLNRLGVGGQWVELLPSAANRSKAW